MGPSGSGKSTLMHILAGLDRPTAGTVGSTEPRSRTLKDNELTKLRRKHIGFVFQFFNLLPMLTAEENVDAAALDRRREARARSGSRSCSTRPASPTAARTGPRSSPAASSSASRSLARSSPGRRSSSPTSRPATSTRRPRPRSSASCAAPSTTYGQTTVMVTHDPRAATIADRILFLADGLIVKELGRSIADRDPRDPRRR